MKILKSVTPYYKEVSNYVRTYWQEVPKPFSVTNAKFWCKELFCILISAVCLPYKFNFSFNWFSSYEYGYVVCIRIVAFFYCISLLLLCIFVCMMMFIETNCCFITDCAKFGAYSKKSNISRIFSRTWRLRC